MTNNVAGNIRHVIELFIERKIVGTSAEKKGKVGGVGEVGRLVSRDDIGRRSVVLAVA